MPSPPTNFQLLKGDADNLVRHLPELRNFAQALLFGPGGKLFVPITGNDSATTGQVRRYDVATRQIEIFVAAGTFLSSPYYLTFEKTNPGTLTYGEHGRRD